MEDGKLKRRAWTTSEERLLVDGAGRIPPCEICRLLDRSESSIKAKAAELRRRGMEVSLRYYESDLVWCPKCATWRTKVFKRSGECIVCRLKERLARQEEKCSVSLSEMPDDARAAFLAKQFKRGSIVPPKPVIAQPKNNSPYCKAETDANHAVSIEQWEASYYRKLISAEKMRLSRIRKKLETCVAHQQSARTGRSDSPPGLRECEPNSK